MKRNLEGSISVSYQGGNYKEYRAFVDVGYSTIHGTGITPHEAIGNALKNLQLLNKRYYK